MHFFKEGSLMAETRTEKSHQNVEYEFIPLLIKYS